MAEGLDHSYTWDQVEKSLRRTQEKTGLDTYSFDKVRIDYSLSNDTLAMTSYRRGFFRDTTTLRVNPRFPYLSEDDQDLVITHESIHGNMFNNQLNPQLRNLGFSRESRRFINSNFNRGLDRLEGTTQYLTESLYPEMQQTSLNIYPWRTNHVRRNASRKGIDIEEELERTAS